MVTEDSLAKQSLEYAESIINTVREPLIALDHDLRVVTVNRSFYECFQVKPEETVGQLIYDLGNKQWDIPMLRELLETILPQQTTFDDYEVDHVFTTIGRRIMRLNARQIERAWGKERIILLAIEDITERRRLEDLLAESEERYMVDRAQLAQCNIRDVTERKNAEDMLTEEKNKAQKYLDVAGVMIVALDSRGRIKLINKRGLEILGYQENEVIGQNWFDLCVPGTISEKVQEVFSKLMSGAVGMVEYFENPITTKGGEERILAFHNALLRDAAGEASGVIFSGEDITERKKSEEYLKEERAFTENALNFRKVNPRLCRGTTTV